MRLGLVLEFDEAKMRAGVKVKHVYYHYYYSD